jgi:hypothetical protein
LRKFRRIFEQNYIQIGKNTEGVTQLNFDKKAKLDVDRKMHVYILNKKRKKNTSQNTVLPPTHRQKLTHKKPNGGGYAAAQTFCEIKKRHPFFD